MTRVNKIILLAVWGVSTAVYGGQGPRFFQRHLPGELIRHSLRTLRHRPVLLGQFRLGALQMRAIRGKRLDFRLRGSRPLAVSGLPRVPQLSQVFTVDSGKVAEAYLENIVVEETNESVPIAQSPEAFVWGLKDRVKFNRIQSGRYFPGNLVQSFQNKSSLFVNLFPVQIDLLTGKVLKVVSADIHVSYADKPLSLGWEELGATPSVIVTSLKLKKSAEILKNYHEGQLGIKTSIITAEEIDEKETPIPEEFLPSGYKNLDQRDNFVKPYDNQKKTGYHYELARKISHFLQKRMGDSSPLKYVTILGDAEQVPPSYYFAYYVEVSRNFTPTDACYGAVKECGEPKVAVGRLPFTNEEETTSYISKVEAWRKFAEHSEKELSLFGGKAFPQSDVYVGELGTLNTIQDNQLDWRGVEKNFKTQNRYVKNSLDEIVRGNATTPFAYHLDHGNGNEWYVEKEYIPSSEILKTTTTESRPSLMVSISCSNAAFDEKITNEAVFEDPSHGDISIGSSLLRSKGGAVAYLGAVRPAIGMPVYQFDDFGNVELNGANYGLQILETFFKKYGVSRQGRLGDFSLKALQAFVFENGNDMKVDQNLWSYFITELLGDPVIPLPQRTKGYYSFDPGKSNLKLDNSLGFGLPILRLKDFVDQSIPLSIIQSVEATLFKINESEFGAYEGEQKILNQTIENLEQPALFIEDSIKLSQGKYFLRLENTVGVPRERQVYFNVE